MLKCSAINCTNCSGNKNGLNFHCVPAVNKELR